MNWEGQSETEITIVMTNIPEKRPLISVVIPAYNHERFVGAAIESVLGQTVDDLELIVVDDGSTDKTAEVIQGYTDSRLTYYHQENQDAYNTINRGMSLARGRFISILNSDDIYSHDRLERILIHQKENHGQCLITDVVPISDNGVEYSDPEFGWNIWHKKNRDIYSSSADIYQAFLHGNFMVTTSNLFMTSDAAKSVGDFCSLRYLHDYDYIFRLMLKFPENVFYLYDEKLLYYRIHDGNTLGEAAIIGREQDQELILKYMMAKLPAEYRKYIQTGGKRLIELGDELHDVKKMIEPELEQGVRPAVGNLKKSLRNWFGKKIN